MKNLFGKFASFAVCLSVATAFTACHQEDAPDPQEQVVHENVEVALNTTRTLVVSLTGNGASVANVTYAGKAGARTGNNFTFENAAATGTLRVTGGTIVPQNPLTVNFGERTTLVIEVNAVLASTNVVSQAAAESGNDVTNDGNNQSGTGVAATVNLGTGNTVTYAGSVKDYSVTVFTPAAAPEASLTPNASYTRAPYAVACNPDGAQFTNPVDITLNVKGAGDISNSGFEFINDKQGDKASSLDVAGDVITGKVKHFSNWNLFVTATCQSITEGQEEIAKGSLVNGENKISYNQKVGFSSQESGILAVWAKMLFGAPMTQVAKTTIITATGAGSYTISQKTFTANFKAGNKTFSVVTYGEPTCNVTYTGTVVPETEPVVPTHGGGSN